MKTTKKSSIRQNSGKNKDTSTSSKSKKSFLYRANYVVKKIKSTTVGGSGQSTSYDVFLEESIFNSLKELASVLKKKGIAIENVTVFKKEKNKSSKWIELKKEQFAHKNKYYDLSKSTDGTGFYYVWEWEKKSPFDQEAIPLNSIKGGFAVANNHQPYVVDVIPTKTKWQKFKSFLSKLFN